MTNKSALYFLILAFLVFACRQNAKETFDYGLLQVDTNYIKVFKYDSALYTFPKFSEPLALTNDDVKLVDSLLIDAVQKFNRTNSKGLYEAFNKQFPIDIFTIDLTKYKRQYFPYKDNNGQKVFQVHQHIVCCNSNDTHYGICRAHAQLWFWRRLVLQISAGLECYAACCIHCGFYYYSKCKKISRKSYF